MASKEQRRKNVVGEGDGEAQFKGESGQVKLVVLSGRGNKQSGPFVWGGFESTNSKSMILSFAGGADQSPIGALHEEAPIKPASGQTRSTDLASQPVTSVRCLVPSCTNLLRIYLSDRH